MYYKIINKECEIYKTLHQLRTKELAIEKTNIVTIEQRSGSTFSNFLGHRGQGGFSRVTRYTGLKFDQPDKIDSKAWKLDSKYREEGVYVPNRRTKVGKQMHKMLTEELDSSSFRVIMDTLDLESLRRFTFPHLDIVGDNELVLYLDDNHKCDNEDVIEITSKEFEAMRDML